MRVSMRNQYSNFLYHLQDTQSKLMDLNMQSSSQKRINKPSDDAIGAGQVLNYRGSLAAIDQYQSNIDVGKGWLSLADETLMQTSTVLTTLKGLAEQGSTGTMTGSDRDATSYQVRQLFSQLVSLSNTTYQGNSIFGGHKVGKNAFTEALMVYDNEGENVGVATGQSENSILVQLVGTEGTQATVGSDTISYRYTTDGGTTWSAVQTSADGSLDLGGVSFSLANGQSYDLSEATNTTTSVGTWFTVAPTALYRGDHEEQSAVTYSTSGNTFNALPLGGFAKDVLVTVPAGVTFDDDTPFNVDVEIDGVTTTVQVENSTATPIIETPLGGIQLSGSGTGAGSILLIHSGATGVVNFGADVNAVGQGVFSKDVMVRIDNLDGGGLPTTIDIGAGAIEYSYSTDGGVNWSTGHTASNTADPAELLVPGGKLILSARDSSNTLSTNDQFVIHPLTADRDLEISPGETVTLNNIGSEVFGGYYEHGSEPIFSDTDVAKNVFVTVGKLVAALENNDQTACADALENLQSAQDHLANQMASVGARENRLDVAGTVLSGLKLNETERMSNIEDVDLASLITDMANQQLSYEAVLKSSSMIMKMGLINYL